MRRGFATEAFATSHSDSLGLNPDIHGDSVEALPSDFEWQGKNFFLRGVMLGDHEHFTSLMRCGNGWMHCDGMLGVPRFEFFPLGSGLEAMKGRDVALVFYEITDSNHFHQVGNPKANLNKLFSARNTTPKPVDEETSDDDDIEAAASKDEERKAVNEGLRSLGKDMNRLMKDEEKKMKDEKKQPKAGKKTASKKKRDSWGFSKRATPPKAGRKPRCKGCKMVIERSDECINHVWKKPGNNHPDRDKYHCNSKCLGKLKREHKLHFINLAWNGDEQTKMVRDELKKQLKK